MKSRVVLAVGVVCAVGIAGIVVACSDDEATIAPGRNDGGNSAETSTSGDTGTPKQDGGGTTDDDGGDIITDGGVNIDPDASDDDDAGDAGCNILVNTGPLVTSACISREPAWQGGALSPGIYELTAVDALGDPAFCTNRFRPVGFQETIQLDVAENGVATAQTVSRVAALRERRRTSRLDPGDASDATLQSTLICPPANRPANVRYTSRERDGGAVLLMRLGYGDGGAAVYRFVK